MAFNNVRDILSIRSPLGSLKLLCVAAIFSRPQFRFLWRSILRPFVRNGEVPVRYWCVKRYQTIFLRMPELESDFQSALELGARDSYHIDAAFHPDLVIDGGGNIGLFTLRVAAMESAAPQPPRIVIYEPMPHNSAQCRRHLEINGVQAEIVNACLGGARRSIPFYCRGAIDSSFDPEKPYDKVDEMPVHLLKDAIGNASAERILIKLDIEGMEVEALAALLPEEKRPVYVVGELHEYRVNASLLKKLFEEYGWNFEFGRNNDNQAMFQACSPAALPLLPSMARRGAASQTASATAH